MSKKKRNNIDILAIVLTIFVVGSALILYGAVGVKKKSEPDVSEAVPIEIPTEPDPIIIVGPGEMEEYNASEESEPESLLQEAETEETEISLLFGGDVYLSSHVLNAYDTAGGISGVVDEEFRQIIQESDYFMVNQEFPFSSRGTAAEDKQFTFRLPPERVRILQDMGVDMVTLANNHSMDYGAEALLDSCQTLDEAGIRHIGAGADMKEARGLETVEIKGKTIGFLGASRVIPVYEWTAGPDTPGLAITYNPSMLIEDIAAAKQICDYVVVYVHWGKEKSEIPEEYQKTMGRQYIEAGADVVIGSHPHVLQGIEYYQGKPIVYSLGNFVFGSKIPRTMLLQVNLGEGGITMKAYPGSSLAGYTAVEKNPEEVSAFYEKLHNMSVNIVIDDQGYISGIN